MSKERNNETQEAIKREVKALQLSCVDACNIIENSPLDTQYMNTESIADYTLRYVEGVRVEIENHKTAVAVDDNLLTSQFYSDLMERKEEIKELEALNRSYLLALDLEVNRLASLINTSEEARARPKVQKQDVKPEHIQKAKEKFHEMKSDLHGLIQSLYPSNSEGITDVLGQLMQQRLNETSNGYIEITAENYQIIELLKDANLVVANPYNNMEVKLSY